MHIVQTTSQLDNTKIENIYDIQTNIANDKSIRGTF